MSDFSEKELPIDGRKLTLISILSAVIWLVIGNLIIHFIQERNLAVIFFGGSNVLIQVGVGVGTGTLIGVAGAGLIRIPSFRKILDEYAIIRQVKEFNLTPPQIVYISLVAGISEEILFRAAIQPVLGIWLTSIIFIGIHGYIRFESLNHILYSLFTFLLSMALGVLFIYFGLISAITAHFIYDAIVLYDITRNTKTEKSVEKE